MSDLMYQLGAWMIAFFAVGGYWEIYEKSRALAFGILVLGIFAFDLFLHHFRGFHP